MKVILLGFFIILYNSLLGQKIISYKFRKEHDGDKILFFGTMQPTTVTDYIKNVPTTFIFDSLKSTVKIDSKIWRISDHFNNCYRLTLYKNIMMGSFDKDSKLCEMCFLTKEGPFEDMIIINYSYGKFRYNFKSTKWNLPFDYSQEYTITQSPGSNKTTKNIKN